MNIFAKVGVDRRTDGAMLEVSDGARALYFGGRLQTRGQERDGKLSRAEVRCIWGRGAANFGFASELVAAGLWAESSDGWTDLGYLDDGNELRVDIAKRRADAAARQKVARERKREGAYPPSELSSENKTPRVTGDVTGRVTRDRRHTVTRDHHVSAGSGSGSVSDSPEGVQGEPTVEPPSGARAAAGPPIGPRELEYRAAYGRGVERGSGVPWVFDWRPWDQGALNACLPLFARYSNGEQIRGPELLQWIELAAKDFAADVTRGGRAQFYGGFSPKGFARWIAEDEAKKRQQREAKACP